jgi:xanthine dehydrogenase YagS FAD-binding subunit
MTGFAWLVPRTLSDAAGSASATVAAAMGRPGTEAVIKAGGVDLLDLVKETLLAPATVVNLAAVPGLDAIAADASGGLRIGAMASLAKVAADDAVTRRYPALADAAGASASPQIRQLATLAGNLLQRPRCWYFRSAADHCLRKGGHHCYALDGDNRYHAVFDNLPCAIVHPSSAATALTALGASVEIVGAGGAARRVPLADFFVLPSEDPHRENRLGAHELLTAILLPPTSAATRMAYRRLSEKAAFDWPLADAAVVLELAADGICRKAAVVLGAAAPAPHRASAAESALIGRRIDEAAARDAGRAAIAGATPLDGNAYKLPLFETLVRRTVAAAAARSAM